MGLHGKAHAAMAECRIQKNAIKRKKARLRALENENRRLGKQIEELEREVESLQVPQQVIEEEVTKRVEGMIRQVGRRNQ